MAKNKKNKHQLRVEKSERRKANKSHTTYQSPREQESHGWMRQHVVNRVLGMFGGY
jgi:hypothetical protein